MLRERVDQAERERPLRPHDDQVRLLGPCELHYPPHVVGLNAGVFGDERRPGVPGSDGHLVTPVGEDGGEGVLPRSRTHDDHPFHAAHRARPKACA